MHKWSVKVSVNGKELKPENHSEQIDSANRNFQKMVTEDYGGEELNGTKEGSGNPPSQGSLWTELLKMQDATYYASPDFGRKR